jgi:altronate dehydratase small subunit
VSSALASDPRLLRLADGDNVLIVTAPIVEGERLVVEGRPVAAGSTLALGFKVAADDLDEGTIALRYGMPIGRTTAAVERGQLIHTHNLESLYMRTHARGEA